METLKLDQSVLVKLDFLIALLGRIEHVVIDVGSHGADTVHTTDALHQASGVPRRIVVHDDIGAMKVNTFRQYIGSDDDIIFHGIARIVGIEILLDGLSQTGAVGSSHHQYIRTSQFLGQPFLQISQGIYTFGE